MGYLRYPLLHYFVPQGFDASQDPEEVLVLSQDSALSQVLEVSQDPEEDLVLSQDLALSQVFSDEHAEDSIEHAGAAESLEQVVASVFFEEQQVSVVLAFAARLQLELSSHVAVPPSWLGQVVHALVPHVEALGFLCFSINALAATPAAKSIMKPNAAYFILPPFLPTPASGQLPDGQHD